MPYTIYQEPRTIVDRTSALFIIDECVFNNMLSDTWICSVPASEKKIKEIMHTAIINSCIQPFDNYVSSQFQIGIKNHDKDKAPFWI